MADHAPYRVEFRQAYQIRVLASHLDAKPNQRSLDLFVSRLKLEGKTVKDVSHFIDESYFNTAIKP